MKKIASFVVKITTIGSVEVELPSAAGGLVQAVGIKLEKGRCGQQSRRAQPERRSRLHSWRRRGGTLAVDSGCDFDDENWVILLCLPIAFATPLWLRCPS